MGQFDTHFFTHLRNQCEKEFLVFSESLAFEIAATEKEIASVDLRLRQLRRKLKKLNAFLDDFSSSPSEPITDKESSND